MKFAVISDSHGHTDNVGRLAVRLNRAGIKTAIHLGDDYDDASALLAAGLEVLRVPGVFSDYYQDPSIPNRVVTEIGDLKVMLTHADSLRLIRVSDLVLSHWSNVCMESVFLKKPTIVLDYVGRGDNYDIFRSGAAVRVTDLASLKAAADGFLVNGRDEASLDECDRIMTEYVDNAARGATERITDFIAKN